MAIRIANKLREDVLDMNKNLNCIDLVSRPGLRERHWDAIKEVLNMPQINPKEITLNKLLQNNIVDHLTKIEDISENASKEFTLETALDKMDKEWESISFVVINFKNRNIKILQGASVEDIQILLDDHTLKAQTIRQNPNIKFMESRAIKWEELMLYIQAVLDVWIRVQSMYLYLEPIFGYEDISKTLATEAEKFSHVTETWNMIMDYVEQDARVLHIEKIPNLLKELNHCAKFIEEIQKGLEELLESKRLDFPRFFFLSNDDLLTILAETRDPLLVQPHMKKCFEGISEILFNNNVDIIGMKSSEGEEITFLERISPKNYKSNVEKWLIKVEEQMKASIAKVMEDSLIDLKSNLDMKTEWTRHWPGQVVLAINQLSWTEGVEETLKISSGGVERLK